LELPEHEHERRDYIHAPWFFFRAGGGLMAPFGQIGTNAANLGLSMTGLLQVGLRLGEELRLVVRYQTYSSGSRLTNASDPVGLTYDGTVAMVGLEQEFVTTETHSFFAGVYAGIDLTSTVEAQTGPTGHDLLPSEFPDVVISGNQQHSTITRKGYS